MVLKYAVNIEMTSKVYDIEFLKNNVSEERQRRIENFLFMKDKLHCIWAELLLRYSLYHGYGIKDQLQIAKGRFGKPYFVDRNDIFFNISHSGKWVVCVLSDEPVGTDVEMIEERKMRYLDNVFTSEEHTMINSYYGKERIEEFFRIWTLKECYVKTSGEGLNIPFDSFCFRLINGEIRLYKDNEWIYDYKFETEKIDEDHINSICCKKNKNHQHICNYFVGNDEIVERVLIQTK